MSEVDPKQRVPIPPGVKTKRVRVVNPPGFGTYGRYELGDELDLPEYDWLNHIPVFMEEVGGNPDPWPPKIETAEKKYKKAVKKTKRGRLAKVKIPKEDGDD